MELRLEFGQSGDVPVPAGYDGDGRADPAVFRPSEGLWMIGQDEFIRTLSFANGAAVPVPADYDGDGPADPAVFNEGIWYIEGSAAAFMPFHAA